MSVSGGFGAEAVTTRCIQAHPAPALTLPMRAPTVAWQTRHIVGWPSGSVNRTLDTPLRDAALVSIGRLVSPFQHHRPPGCTHGVKEDHQKQRNTITCDTFASRNHASDSHVEHFRKTRPDHPDLSPSLFHTHQDREPYSSGCHVSHVMHYHSSSIPPFPINMTQHHLKPNPTSTHVPSIIHVSAPRPSASHRYRIPSHHPPPPSAFGNGPTGQFLAQASHPS
jgi:hypothetical protein